MANAIKVTPEGDVIELDIPAPAGTLDWLYREIGCSLVDLVRMGPAYDMWLDDEGAFVNDGKNVNLLATAVNLVFGNTHPALWGTAVITRHDDEGNTTGLSPAEAAEMAAMLRELRARIAEELRPPAWLN